MNLRWIFLAMILTVLIAATHRGQNVPVTVVAIPWGTATIDGGVPFVVPSTVILEPGDYRLVVERQGYWPVERNLRVEAGSAQNHLVRLERR